MAWPISELEWPLSATATFRICRESSAYELMADLNAIIAQLKEERTKLDKAIEALSGLTRNSGDAGNGTRKLSAAARERIAAAQRARWAKWKGKKRR